MKKPTNRYSISKLEILAYYQIIGGLIGFGVIIYLISSLESFPLLLIVMLLISSGLYSYSILCGILIFKNKIKGLKYSRINQFLQILSFSIFGYGFKYFSGLYFSIEIDLINLFNIKIDLGTSTWFISFNDDLGIRKVSINIVALFLIIFIDRQIIKIEKIGLENKLSKIGIEN